ncbi:MAG TPA: GYF domain-containing protein [Polyangia bacterium]|nr:GYF domain-containing protein [Polyangia bacterium]
MKIICDSCGTKYSISDDKVRGKVFKIRCKKCSHIIVVRGGETQDEAAAAPVAAAADGGWHIVVEGEQVGPISEADVRARVERGEIRADTYIWKEGFADWLKLSAVPEFADIAPPTDSGSVSIGDVFSSSTNDAVVQPTNGTERSGGRRRSGANRPLFGDGGGDVFAAPAAAASSGGDLFGSASAHSTASNWPSSSGGGASMAGHDGGRVENLTGQRHENSVLFSLSNLQSLAMPSAKPAASAIPSTAPTTEGSGLIDIRAMAANTRPAALDGPGAVSGDDLPSFGAFSPAAPVLLPMPSSSGPPWWIYLVIIGMLALVGGIGFMAWRVISPKQVVVVKEVQVPAPAPAPTTVAAKTPGEKDKAPSTIDEKDLPPRDGKDAKGEDKGKESGKDKSSHRSSKGSSSKESGGKKPVAAETKADKPTGPVPGEPPKPKPGSLEALLNEASPQKATNKPKVSEDKGGGGGDAGPLPKNALVAGLKGVQPKVSACYNQFKVPGTAMVNIVIGKNGKVTKADVTGKFAGTPTGTCVEAAVKTASFPPSDGFSTPYPFQLK